MMSTNTAALHAAESCPFLLQNEALYRRWRDRKLEGYPDDVGSMVVEIGDPAHPTDAEVEAMMTRLRKTNMVVYASRAGEREDKDLPRRLGERFGLRRLDNNWLADDDGITSLTVNPDGAHPRYIPYTDRPISWHTDGYYNPPERQIHGLLLHCVRPAPQGGENALFDPELAYIALRDEDPTHIDALMLPDAMTIPPGTSADGGTRGEAVGPVFSIAPDGHLHMRYTARKRNIEWKDDPRVRAAVASLEALLAGQDRRIFRATLRSGMGLVSNNVLHDRSGFEGDAGGAPGRLLYRARYYDRVAGT